MKRVVPFGILGLAALFAAGAAVAADLSVAVVDMERCIRAHPDTESSEAMLEEQAAEFEDEAKEMLEAYQKLEKEFESLTLESMSKALSDSARDEKRDAARAMRTELGEKERIVRETLVLRKKQLADRRARMKRKILSDIETVIREHAEQNKLDLVLDASSEGLSGAETVVFARAEMDITEAVVEALANE